ncbi:hypothetical protein CLV98_111113 [Dyadobacter jejuensis]|uniref:Uncharacterized protein n=1 Tax=Dyadobacter jejuensis TaxID=1082580 RepID=A0A316AH61_9BACT|nr:hypothetical protein CLV98_111113 [Dyadobacter jejuensis]
MLSLQKKIASSEISQTDKTMNYPESQQTDLLLNLF